MWGIVRALGLVFLLCTCARADVGLLLGESTGLGMSRWTSAGHSAVYLSNVCADSPIHLRPCAPGQQGIVLSNYVTFSENKPYEWNAVPLSVFLYGVDDPQNRPLYASPELRAALQNRVRETWLRDICPEGPCTDSKSHWRDMIAATFVRDVYMFVASTTPAQDEAFIAKFNTLPNVDHYNGFTRNCADFARIVVNTYFPGAAKPDHMNDFWMTSPKAISKSFTHYAVKHKLNFHVVRYTQIPGSYRPSSDARKGTELVFTTKKWFFPMLLKSNELAIFTASYLLTGRFNPERELHRRPTEEVTAQIIEAKSARRSHERDLARELTSQSDEIRKQEFGTAEQWERYSAALAEYTADAGQRRLSVVQNAKDFANAMDENAAPVIDGDGALWLEYRDGESVRRVGASASNVNAVGSDAGLAYQMMLVRVRAELHSPAKNREMLPEFESDWRLLQEARHSLNSKSLAAEPSDSGEQEPPVKTLLAIPAGSSLLP